MMTKREHWVDSVKGFAIICVVLGHVNGRVCFLYNWIYSFHIPIFFIVSGILLSLNSDWENKGNYDILRKKVLQLLYPYLTFSMLTLVWICMSRGPSVMIEVLKTTIILDGYSALWFLPTLLFAEILFMYLHKSRFKDTYSAIILIVISIPCAYVYTIFGRGRVNHSEFSSYLYTILNILTRSIIGSIFVLIGYWGHRKKREFILKKPYFILAIVLFVINMFVVQYNGFVDLHRAIINNFVLYYLFAVIGSYLVIIIMKYGVKQNRILEYFGRNSLIIMGTHLTLPGMGIIRGIFVKVFSYLTLNTTSYIYDFCVCFFTMLFEIIVIEFVNRFARFIIKCPGITVSPKRNL